MIAYINACIYILRGVLLKSLINKNYIVKQSSGDEWYFSHRENIGICFGSIIDKRMSNFEILLKDGKGDFDVIVDNEDIFHLICQDKNGDIIYLIYRDNKWLKYVILKSKTNKSYRKYFKILSINNQINLLYIIDYKEEKLLVHQILNGETQPPNVVGLISEASLPFCSTFDASGNIYVYYKSKATENNTGYSKYSAIKKEWQIFIPIDNFPLSSQLPYVIIDKNNMLHLAYVKKTDNNSNIVYRSLSTEHTENESIVNEKIVSTIQYDNVLPVILITGNKIWILWSRAYNVFSCSSHDDGNTWSMPSQFMTVRNGSVDLFGYRTMVAEEISSIFVDLSYGYQNGNNINLYILPSYVEQLKRLSAERKNQKTLNVDKNIVVNNDIIENKIIDENTSYSINIDITKLKIEITSLKEAIISLNKKFDSLTKQVLGSTINAIKSESTDDANNQGGVL